MSLTGRTGIGKGQAQTDTASDAGPQKPPAPSINGTTLTHKPIPYNLPDTYSRGQRSLMPSFLFAEVGFTHPLFSWRVRDAGLSYVQQTGGRDMGAT
jgi:hypothetical protein